MNKYASRSFFRIDFGDFIVDVLIYNIWAPPVYEAKFYLNFIGERGVEDDEKDEKDGDGEDDENFCVKYVS